MNRLISISTILALVLTLLAVMVLPDLMAQQLPGVTFSHLKRDHELFSSAYAPIIEDNRGFIWFGSNDGGGLYRFDGYDLVSFVTDPNNLSGSLSSSRVFCITQVNDTLIYVGTTFGFSALNPVTRQVRNFNNDSDAIGYFQRGVVVSMTPDSIREVIWLGTMAGLSQFDPGSGTTTDKYPEVKLPGSQIPKSVTRIVMDQSDPDMLWLASPTGLYKYQVESETYAQVNPPDYGNRQLHVTAITQEGSDLYIGTASGEMFIFDKSSLTWKTHQVMDSDSRQGQRTIYTIRGTRDSSVWVSTSQNVGIYDLRTKIYTAWEYDPANPAGLLPLGGYQGLMNDRHGRMWIGSTNGMQYSDQAFMEASVPPKDLEVQIINVQASPVLVDTMGPLLYQGTLVLDQSQRDITFQYVLPNPKVPNNVVYQYMLKGYDKDWIETDQRSVRYTNLPGGQYQFLVRGKDISDAEWIDGSPLGVMIPKILTERTGFWVILLLGLAGLAVGINYIIVRNVRRNARIKAEYDNQLSEIQMQALRAQMNPHFLFNSLNSIKYYAISKTQQETAAYVSKFASLVRAILQNSKSRTISLQDELEALKLYIEIEHIRLEGKFDYSFDIDSSLQVQHAQIPPMILQPYVENAIWHGLMHRDGQGRLTIQVKDLGNQIQCIIEDNGVGRDRAAELKQSQMGYKKSVGMQITGDRIELINRIYHVDTTISIIDLKDREGRASGTRVVINIPLIEDDYN